MTPTIKLQTQAAQPIDNVETGAEVKRYREFCGVLQCDLAKKMGVSGVTISHREKGRFDWTQEAFDQHIKAINQLK